jgi:hypothetical protein
MVDKQGILHFLKFLVVPSISSNKVLFIIFGILLFALLVDSSLLNIYTFLNSIFLFDQQYLIFIIITFLFIVGQYFILAIVRIRIKKVESTWKLHRIVHNSVTISQYLMSLFLLIIILEIFFNSYYSTVLLILITIISYGLSCISLGLLALRFFLVFRLKKSYSILFYSLSSIAFVISNLFLMIFVLRIIPQIGNVIQRHGHIILYFNDPGSFEYVLYNGYAISSIIAFIITWIATAIILYNYANRIGKIKYWIIISLPLVYFLSQFVSLFLDILNNIIEQNIFLYMILFTVIFSISKAAGSIQFGIAFWVMVKKMNKMVVLRDFLIIVTIGFMLLFVSEQAVSLISFPYPPFGLASVATLGLSSYLILVGLYYSAVSISKDVNMRKFILSSALNEVNFLIKIGSAEVEKETEKIVNKLIYQNLKEIKYEIGITSPENVREYLDEIVDEIKKMKGIT